MTMIMNKEVSFDDFQIVPIPSSVKRLKISDEEYFSEKYENYVSNSRLKWINPDQGGTKELFLNPPKFKTNSLILGSCVHENILEPECFDLPPEVDRPTAKLGDVIDFVIKYRKEGLSIYDSIKKACEDAEYYLNIWENKIHYIISKGLKYYFQAKDAKDNVKLLDKNTRQTAIACINSVNTNAVIQSKLHPKNDFDEDILSFNEDTLLMDVAVIYKDRATVIKLKAKADNWTIDTDGKVLTLNDLKTTGKNIDWFMRDFGSMIKYHYPRQMAMYSFMLQEYCKKQYGFNQDWDFNCNMLVVETINNYRSNCFRVNETLKKKKKREFEELIKRVAYFQIFPEANSNINFY